MPKLRPRCVVSDNSLNCMNLGYSYHSMTRDVPHYVAWKQHIWVDNVHKPDAAFSE